MALHEGNILGSPESTPEQELTEISRLLADDPEALMLAPDVLSPHQQYVLRVICANTRMTTTRLPK